MLLARSKKVAFVTQGKCTLDIFTETRKIRNRPVNTHLEQNWKSRSTKTNHPMDKAIYQLLVGKLIYLSLSRLDIAFRVSVISQFMHSPTQRRLGTTNLIFRYLKGTPGKGLLFRKYDNQKIECYADANWVGLVEDNKSTTGYCTKLWGNLVTWKSK